MTCLREEVARIVSVGAAVQGGLIAGIDVGPLLVDIIDITPHTLGIEALSDRDGFPTPHAFSPIIERNTPLPATRTEVYTTTIDGQKEAEIRVFQGEEDDARFNTLVGEFVIQGLANVPAPNQILVQLNLDLNGILRVTATERATGLAKQVVIDNMMERFRHRERTDALERIDALFADSDDTGELEEDEDDDDLDTGSAAVPEIAGSDLQKAIDAANLQIAKAGQLEGSASREDAAEMGGLVQDLQAAIARQLLEDIRRVIAELEDLIFYLNDS